MEKISIESAEQKMFELLDKEDMGDRIYEFTQELYQRYIRKIEDKFNIDCSDCMSRDEEWYDDVRDEFFQAVYDRTIKFMKG